MSKIIIHESHEAAREWHKKWIASLSTDEPVCGACGDLVESYEQVGRCFYADPCGHRQGQGRAPDLTWRKTPR